MNSLFLKALRGEKTDRPPIWLMRQAGRYLPEYRELRAKNSMLQMVRTPELATEVTLQPIRRFGFDASIIFADILTPLIGMGANLDFKAGEGPVIDNPVRSVADIQGLKVPPPEENVDYTLKAITMTAQALGKTPLIGFSGAPFTLTCYLIEGGSPGDLERVKSFMYSEPEAWVLLQKKLVTLVTDYLVAQVEAGAAALQIFDSWLGYLGPSDYEQFVAPYLEEIVRGVKSRTTVPVIFFATGVTGLFPRLRRLPVEAFGVDWRCSLTDAAAMIGHERTLQGNLDPQKLTGPWNLIEADVDRIIAEGRELRSHIFNLGHGILQTTPIGNVEKLVEKVKGA